MLNVNKAPKDSFSRSYLAQLTTVLVTFFTILPLAIIAVVFLTAKGNDIWIPVIACSIWFVTAVAGLVKEDFRLTSVRVIAVLLAPFFIAGCYFDGVRAVIMLPLLVLLPIIFLKGASRAVVVGLYFVGPLLAALYSVGSDWPYLTRSLTASIGVASIVATFSWTIDRFVQRLESQNLELSQLNATQTRLYETVGHELRTPASSIMMLLNEEALNSSTSNLQEAQKQTRHLLSILDDMKLSLSTTDLKEFVSTESEISVLEVINRSVKGLNRLAEEHGTAIKVHGKRAHQYGHFGASKAIQQVVQNLIKNAIYHSQSTQIDVTLAYEHQSGEATVFRISVCDNGQGIPATTAATMFNAYQRGESQAEGTGLGLYLCRELAKELNAGDISYHPNPSGGSVFVLSFLLEKKSESPSDTAPQTGSTTTLEGKKILLVEDTPTLRLLGEKLLERAGAEVQCANDGAEALKLLPNFDADIVLTDIMMPVMDGYTLTQNLRDTGFSQIIIGITGATLGDEADKLIACGANRVLPKPLSIAALEAALASIAQAADS